MTTKNPHVRTRVPKEVLDKVTDLAARRGFSTYALVALILTELTSDHIDLILGVTKPATSLPQRDRRHYVNLNQEPF